MAVPTWRRNLSRIEFLYQTYQLEVRIMQITFNISSKYKQTFGVTLLKDCDEALLHGRTANRIFVKNQFQLDTRSYELDLMASCVDNIATHFYVLMELLRHHDGASLKDMEKYYDWANDIGERCDSIIAMINGVKESDRKKFNKNEVSG